MLFKNILRSLRIDQWIKNLFVLFPLLFSKNIQDMNMLYTVVVYTIIFCLISSAVYLFNDILDKDRDAYHPDKKMRPVASGAVSRGSALFFSLLLGSVGLLLGFYLSFTGGIICLIYIVNNLLYSFYLKKIVVLDVIVIAVGFVLRVIGGAAVINVTASVWLIMCTFLLSLFLGFCKRKQELIVFENETNEHRTVLKWYNLSYLDHMISVVSACTVISYALYTVNSETVEKFGSSNLIYTLPFVLYGIFRYMYNVNVLLSRKSTSIILFSDKSLMINIVLWAFVSGIIIYF